MIHSAETENELLILMSWLQWVQNRKASVAPMLCQELVMHVFDSLFSHLQGGGNSA